MAKKKQEKVLGEAGLAMAKAMREKAPFSGPKAIDPSSGGASAHEIGLLNCRLRPRAHRIDQIIVG